MSDVRAHKMRACYVLQASRVTVPAAFTMCWPARQSSSPSAFAMHSMAHSRRRAALSEIWPLVATKTAIFSLGNIFSGFASRSCQSKHLAAERSRLVLRGRKTGFPAKSPLLGITNLVSRDRNTMPELQPPSRDAGSALYGTSQWRDGQFSIPERQKVRGLLMDS